MCARVSLSACVYRLFLYMRAHFRAFGYFFRGALFAYIYANKNACTVLARERVREYARTALHLLFRRNFPGAGDIALCFVGAARAEFISVCYALGTLLGL